METKRGSSVVLPTVGLSLPQIAKKAGQSSGLFPAGGAGQRNRKRLSSLISSSLLDKSQAMSKARGRRGSAAESAYGGKSSRPGMRDKDTETVFMPKYDENEKPPAVRFIYSEAVRKTLKRCGLSMSRLARSRASAVSPVDYMDNTDDSLELPFVQDISSAVVERIQQRQSDPARYMRQDTGRSRINSSMRAMGRRPSRVGSITQLLARGMARAETGVDNFRLPPVQGALREEEEHAAEDMRDKIAALLTPRQGAEEAAPKGKGKLPVISGDTLSLPPLKEMKRILTIPEAIGEHAEEEEDS